MADRYCNNCGHALSRDDRFCSNCGRPTAPDVQAPPPLQPHRSRASRDSVASASVASTSSSMR
jgi:predicted amidophosphoribosyltransferase